LPDFRYERRLEPAEKIYESGFPCWKQIFLGVVPESRSSCRNGNGASASQSSADGGGGGQSNLANNLSLVAATPVHLRFRANDLRKDAKLTARSKVVICITSIVLPTC
jgi:hypothetical protein